MLFVAMYTFVIVTMRLCGQRYCTIIMRGNEYEYSILVSCADISKYIYMTLLQLKVE